MKWDINLDSGYKKLRTMDFYNIVNQLYVNKKLKKKKEQLE